MTLTTPYGIYMKTLYTLVRDRLEGEEHTDILWDDKIKKDLTAFQEAAVNQAVQMIKDYRGAFIAYVFGVGRSYIEATIVKYFDRTESARPLIVCPASFVDMWERYNEVYKLNARVISVGYFRESGDSLNFLLDDVKYRDRDFVLVDESHNFLHPDTNRYQVLQAFLAAGRTARKWCFF